MRKDTVQKGDSCKLMPAERRALCPFFWGSFGQPKLKRRLHVAGKGTQRVMRFAATNGEEAMVYSRGFCRGQYSRKSARSSPARC